MDYSHHYIYLVNNQIDACGDGIGRSMTARRWKPGVPFDDESAPAKKIR
jgi:hypothetical protein